MMASNISLLILISVLALSQTLPSDLFTSERPAGPIPYGPYMSPYSLDRTVYPLWQFHDLGCTMDRIHVSNFTKEIFLQYYANQRPVMIVGGANHWAARSWSRANLVHENATTFKFHSTWKKQDELAHINENFHKETTIDGADGRTDLTFEEFFDHYFDSDVPVVNYEGEAMRSDFGLIDNDALESNDILRKGYSSPPWSEQNVKLGVNYFLTLLEKANNFLKRIGMPTMHGTWRFLITGPAGAGGQLHADYMNTSFWNGMAHGEKHWVFLEDSDILKIMNTDRDLFTGWTTDDPAYDFYTADFPKMQPGGSLWEAGVRPIHCHQDSGDVVYGPGSMYHVVITVQDSLVYSEQMLGDVEFDGAIHYADFVELGFFDDGQFNDLTVKKMDMTQEQVDFIEEHGSVFDDETPTALTIKHRTDMCLEVISLCAGLAEIRPEVFTKMEGCVWFADQCAPLFIQFKESAFREFVRVLYPYNLYNDAALPTYVCYRRTYPNVMLMQPYDEDIHYEEVEEDDDYDDIEIVVPI